MYDNNGNLITSGADTFVWDVRNQLVGATTPGFSASFAYDPMIRMESSRLLQSFSQESSTGVHQLRGNGGGRYGVCAVALSAE